MVKKATYKLLNKNARKIKPIICKARLRNRNYSIIIMSILLSLFAVWIFLTESKMFCLPRGYSCKTNIILTKKLVSRHRTSVWEIFKSTKIRSLKQVQMKTLSSLAFLNSPRLNPIISFHMQRAI